MSNRTRRIIGYDIARAFAVFGMVIVNFKIVIGEKLGTGWLKTGLSLLKGKAAATFVFLAGIGIGLMARRAVKSGDRTKLKAVRISLFKRALFLFVVGLLYMPLWPADILHYYGIYMLLGLLLIGVSDRLIWLLAISIVVLFVPMLLLLNYETGWNFESLEYTDFWTIGGFLRNLFYNGFHPVIPWSAFLVFGMLSDWQKLADGQLRRSVFFGALLVFVLVQLISFTSLYFMEGSAEIPIEDAQALLGTAPMPPMPLYMISGASFALLIVCIGVHIGERWPKSVLVMVFVRTGQLALTLYVAHVLLGMGPILILNGGLIGAYTIDFTLLYALGFCILSTIFSYVWCSYFKRGPLEWLMRKLVE